VNEGRTEMPGSAEHGDRRSAVAFGMFRHGLWAPSIQPPCWLNGDTRLDRQTVDSI
jgi:hypothetical protein